MLQAWRIRHRGYDVVFMSVCIVASFNSAAPLGMLALEKFD